MRKSYQLVDLIAFSECPLKHSHLTEGSVSIPNELSSQDNLLGAALREAFLAYCSEYQIKDYVNYKKIRKIFSEEWAEKKLIYESISPVSPSIDKLVRSYDKLQTFKSWIPRGGEVAVANMDISTSFKEFDLEDKIDLLLVVKSPSSTKTKLQLFIVDNSLNRSASKSFGARLRAKVQTAFIKSELASRDVHIETYILNLYREEKVDINLLTEHSMSYRKTIVSLVDGVNMKFKYPHPSDICFECIFRESCHWSLA